MVAESCKLHRVNRDMMQIRRPSDNIIIRYHPPMQLGGSGYARLVEEFL